MNVAVAAESPLGRYLAELNGDDSMGSAPSAPAIPQATAPLLATDRSRRPPSESSHDHNSSSTIIKRWSLLFMDAQRSASSLLLAKLAASDLFVDLRESVLEAARLRDATPTTTRWWIPQAAVSWNSATAVAAVVVSVFFATNAASSTYVADISSVLLAWWMACILLVAASIFIIGVELLYQLLLCRYSHAALRFVKAMQRYSIARAELHSAFRAVLEIVKRSELAARGYRLGRILPPVGRLEEASSARDPHFELQCYRLRVSLRDINDAIERAGRAVASESLSSLEEINTSAVKRSAVVDRRNKSPDDRASPSLLITALAKRHDLSSLLLENALRDWLVDDLASLLRDPVGATTKDFLSTVTAQAQTYRTLTRMTKAWTADLVRWNTKPPHHNVENKDTKASDTVAGKGLPSDIAAITRALTDVQTSCETILTLTRTSQHDIDEQFQGDQSPTNEAVEEPARLRRKLKESHDQMVKLMQQLASDWDRLEGAVRAADRDEVSCADGSTTASDDIVTTEQDGRDQRQRHLAEIQRQKRDAERDFLLVFTATSTGEKDFDLQSLLRQQQQQRDGADATPVPSFMGELQDVLDRRQALPSAPMLEKRIGDDAPPPHTQVKQATTMSPVPPPQAVDLQKLLQSRFAAQLTELSFGGEESDDDAENVAESGSRD